MKLAACGALSLGLDCIGAEPCRPVEPVTIPHYFVNPGQYTQTPISRTLNPFSDAQSAILSAIFPDTVLARQPAIVLPRWPQHVEEIFGRVPSTARGFHHHVRDAILNEPLAQAP